MQIRPLITAGAVTALLTVMVAPVPPLEMVVPEGEDATVLLILTGTPPVAVAASVTVTTATVPFWIIVALDNPTIRQVYEPFPPAQLSVLLAAVAAEPAVMVTLVMLAVL